MGIGFWRKVVTVCVKWKRTTFFFSHGIFWVSHNDTMITTAWRSRLVINIQWRIQPQILHQLGQSNIPHKGKFH